MKKILKISAKMVLVATMVISMITVVATVNNRSFALSDGAYLVNISLSYAKPETGKTIDGGTNISLGQAMTEGITEKTALVEKINGRTFVTVGIGGMNNVSSMSFFTERGGNLIARSYVVTGSYAKNGDTAKQFRVEVSNTDDYIVPSMYVEPMQRDVKFFIKLNMGTAQSGSGIYNVTMATPAALAQNSPSNSSSQSPSSQSEDSSDKKDDKKSEEKDKEKDKEDKDTKKSEKGTGDKANKNSKDKNSEKAVNKTTKNSSNQIIYIALIVSLLAIASGVGFYLYKRKK